MKRWRPDPNRFDMLLALVAASAAICLPLLLREINLAPGSERLVWTALIAVVVSMILARTRMKTWLIWVSGVGLGLIYSLQFATRILPSVGMLWRDAGRLLSWLWGSVTGGGPAWSGLLATPEHISGQWLTVEAGLIEWFAAVMDGGTSQDNTVLLFIAALAVWLLTWVMGTHLFRTRRPFAGMVPLAIVITSATSYTYLGFNYVQVFVGLMLFCLVRANVHRLEAFWQKLDLDFSPELRRDTTVAGLGITALVLVVALVMPYVTWNRALWAFWDLIGPRVTTFYDELDRAFAGRNPIPSPTPSAQDLGPHGPTEIGTLSDDTVFTVVVSDPPPPSAMELSILEEAGEDITDYITKRYWRDRTYDVYTGHGWDTSSRNPRALREGEPWIESEELDAQPHELVTQTFTFVDQLPPFGFGVNAPYTVDADTELILRGPEDLAAFRVVANEYTVVSRAPWANAYELNQAEGAYPGWVAERYLALPDRPRVPSEVGDLAQEIVDEAGATTRYEMARAIEAYIRSYPYDLTVLPPTLDQDITAYFLFDVQAGYCDYSATAMTVMLRTLGVAARYASGYGQGYYSDALEAWVVTEANGHAWTEVYFPGYGWIEFEPTPSEYIWDRGSATTFDPATLPTPEAESEPAVDRRWPWIIAGALAVIFVVLWPPRWFRKKPTPNEVAMRTYGKLARRSRWASLGLMEGQTPNEWLGTLAIGLDGRTGEITAANEIDIIGQAYQRAAYSNQPLDDQTALRVETAWRRLRGPLAWSVLRKPERG